MKLCQPHWDKLREAIEARGLTRFVAKNGQVTIDRLARELEGTDGPDDYDPLMASNFAIWNNALSYASAQGDPFTLLSEEDICPICWLSAKHDEHCREPECSGSPFETWIDRAADDAKDYIAVHIEGSKP